MNTEVDVVYAPGPVALAFHKDKLSRVKLLIGPFGTGKTSTAAWDVIDFQSRRVRPVRGKKRSRFAVVRNTHPELRDTTIKTYLDWFPPLYFGDDYNQTNCRYTVHIEDREIEILFKALDIPKDVRDLLSLELTGAHVDEAREIHEDVIKGLLGRIGRYPSMKDTEGQNPFLTPPQVILTSNYPSTEHSLYRDFVKNPIEGYEIYNQPQGENKHNLRPGYYEDLEKDYANRPDLLKTLVRGEWGVTVRGKQVYPEFVRSLHVSKGALKPIQTQVIRGWDNTGLSPACVITQIGPTGQWLLLHEFCGEDIGIIDFGEMVNLWCTQTFGSNQKYRDIGDPAGKNRDSNKMSPADYLRKIDIFIEDGIQSFQARREAVAGRLTKLINGEAAMVVDPVCSRLIDGFEGGYAYPEIGKSGVFKDEPAKNIYSHCFTGETKVLTMLGEKEIKDIRVGEYVYTPVGYRVVTATMNSLSNNLREVIFSDGRKVVCTDDHPFYTIQGLAFADALQYNDILLGINTEETKKWGDEYSIQSRNLTALNSTISQMATIRQTIKNMAVFICTAMSGNIIMERLQMGTASTTSMRIRQTIESKTYNLCPAQLTTQDTHVNDSRNLLSLLCKGLRLHKLLPNNGTLHQMGEHGTANMARSHGLVESPKGLFVSFAGKNMRLTHGRRGIARQIANLRHVGYQGSMMLCAYVLNAVGNLRSTSIQKHAPAVRVAQANKLTEPSEHRKVYDLTVDDAHCFFAEGVLVSNCHDATQYIATRLFIHGRKKTETHKQPYIGGEQGWMGA